MPTEVLRLDSIVKTFSGVTALKDVSFDVRSGEVHALVGENGAGKSTLIGVAAGVLEPDSGTVAIGGHWLPQASPEKAQELGIGVVYQHTSLLDDLTVTENLVFSMPENRRPRHSDAPAWVRDHLASVGVDVSPSLRLSSSMKLALATPPQGTSDATAARVTPGNPASASVAVCAKPSARAESYRVTGRSSRNVSNPAGLNPGFIVVSSRSVRSSRAAPMINTSDKPISATTSSRLVRSPRGSVNAV